MGDGGARGLLHVVGGVYGGLPSLQGWGRGRSHVPACAGFGESLTGVRSEAFVRVCFEESGAGGRCMGNIFLCACFSSMMNRNKKCIVYVSIVAVEWRSNWYRRRVLGMYM